MSTIEMQSHGEFLQSNPHITPMPCGALDHAQDLGLRAFNANLNPSNNPYPENTEAWWFWNCGWDGGERLKAVAPILNDIRMRSERAHEGSRPT